MRDTLIRIFKLLTQKGPAAEILPLPDSPEKAEPHTEETPIDA